MVPNLILVGLAEAVVEANTFEECLAACVDAELVSVCIIYAKWMMQAFDFVCSSGIFFGDDNGDNCILNSETRDTVEDLQLIEDDEGVIEYFEPRCAGARRRSAFGKFNFSLDKLRKFSKILTICRRHSPSWTSRR